MERLNITNDGDFRAIKNIFQLMFCALEEEIDFAFYVRTW
jgi:hypothetical protein